MSVTMKRKRWHTDGWLWALTSAVLFGGLMFVNPLEGATDKAEYSLWAYFKMLVDGTGERSILILAIVVQSCALAIPSILLGWVIQALLALCGLRLSSAESKS